MSASFESAGTGTASSGRVDSRRLPPQSLEAEEAVLGALLLDRGAIHQAMELLEPEQFYAPKNAEIFSSMVGLYQRGDAVDLVTLSEELKKRGTLDSAGGSSYLGSLQASVATGANVAHYARIVIEKATLRGMISAAGKIVENCYEGREDPADVLDRAEAEIMSISQGRLKQGFQQVKDILMSSFEEIQKQYQSKGALTGVPTGYTRLDEMTGGMQAGDMIIVAARPSMGKTALCLNIAQTAAIEHKKKVAIFSLEMSKEALVQRLLTSEARVNAHQLRTGHLRDDDWQLLTEAAGHLASAPIFIDDSAASTVLEMRAKARRLQSQHGLDMVIVDYLQLMRATGRSDNRQQEITEISRGLKALAKELSVPVMALSQLSRAVVQRGGDKRPMLSDLRECVTGDTLVCLSDGRRVAIEELVGDSPELIAVDEDGKLFSTKSEIVWPVGEREVYEVKLGSGRSIKTTADHRLLGARGWIKVGELKDGDRLATARSLPEPKNPLRWPELRVALLGQLIGDGSFLSGQPMRYTTQSEENSETVREAAEAEFGCTVKRYAGRRNWHQLLISGNGNRWHPEGVNKWLRDLGVFNQRSHEKRIPKDAFRLSNDQIALLLKHLWATDGSIVVRQPGSRGSHTIYYSTNSPGLAADVLALLSRLGVIARILVSRKGEYRPSNSVMITGVEDQLRFLNLVGAYGPRVPQAENLQKALHAVESNTNVDTLPVEFFDDVRAVMVASGVSHREMAERRGTSYGGSAHFKFAPSRETFSEYAQILDDDDLMKMAESDLFWDRVSSVDFLGIEKVYDLTVPGPACWLADGIVSHNSGALEQDADVVMFINRPEMYDDSDMDTEGVAEIIIGKQRNGPTGSLKLTFVKDYTRFENPAPGDYDDYDV